MLDVRVFRDPVFVIACISNAFGMLGLYVPFVFIADRAIGMGITENKAAFLLSVIGKSVTVKSHQGDHPWDRPKLLK